ncbi:hypothetical protein J22TS3_20290 [Paenibacillus sp. J22TS3]|nr:hypothetical protein J22TS3_20290 [Paenibacillus sp. J22TS3]
MRKTISLCMIVKNEEKVLDRCLTSVKNKVDEIIVVDTGSTDSTVEIAKRYTSKVFSFKWIDDFAAARNYSLEQATSDYILVLDADEYLDSEADVHSAFETSEDYYLVKIRNQLSYGWAHTHTAIRLFANRTDLRYKNKLHEHLSIANDTEISFGKTNFTILHTGYTNEIVQEKDKLARNLDIMLREVEENPDGYNLFNTGNVYYSLNDYNKAIQYYQRSYPLSKERSYSPELLAKMATSLGYLGRYEDGLRILIDAVQLFPSTVDLRFAQGKIYLEAGYLKDAELSFKKCLDIGDQGIAVTEGAGGYGSHYYLAELYLQQGELARSYEKIVEVISANKTFSAGINKYFEITIKGNIPFEDVFQNIELIYNITNVEELKLLLDSMYSQRHPLLNRYLLKYNLLVEDNVKAVALQYDKKYEDAKEIWCVIGVGNGHATDVLLLSVILNDMGLFELATSGLNLSNRELKFLRGLLFDKSTGRFDLTTQLEFILLEVVTRLITLQEFELFERILVVLVSGKDMMFTCKVIKVMTSFGFYEIAIDLLAKCYEQHPNNIDVIGLLGDACLKAGYQQDVEILYSRLLELNLEYSTYERNYNLYSELEDIQGMRTIKNEIKRRFPLSEWASN